MNSDYKILKEAYVNKSEVKSKENYANNKPAYIKLDLRINYKQHKL